MLVHYSCSNMTESCYPLAQNFGTNPTWGPLDIGSINDNNYLLLYTSEPEFAQETGLESNLHLNRILTKSRCVWPYVGLRDATISSK